VRVLSKCGAPRTGGRIIMPTPRARDWKGGSLSDRPIDGGPDLPTAIAMLPTPTTSDGKGGPGKSLGGHDGYNLRTAVTLLPTPGAYDGSRGGPQDPDKRRAGGRSVNLQDAVFPLLPTPRATDGTNGGPSQRGRKGDLAMGSACQPEVWGKFAEAVALWESVTGRPAPDPTVPAPRGGRRLNPALSEWMMGYPDGYVTGELERNAALRAIGNGVVPLQGATAWNLLA
jgi:DNA (cytosine-5)-methyltransferase 1